MRRLTSRTTLAVSCACVSFGLIAVGIGGLGVVGVRSATRSGNVLANDELTTATITGQVGHQVDAVYASAEAAALTADSTLHDQLVTQLFNEQIPAVEAGLSDLDRVHEGDDAAETADVSLLTTQWVSLRSLLAPGISTSTPDPPLAGRLSDAYAPLATHLQALAEREKVDALADQEAAADKGERTMWGIAAAVALTALILAWFGWLASRRFRRAVEPARDQVEFADTLQLAGNEDEAHQLLKRHLQRLVVGGDVTVLNRNNSADRLEAVTDLAAGSALASTLVQAEPRSCLAIRSARTHAEDDQHAALLGCPVCSSCPGLSTCTPLTVGGEVIGSVLVNRTDRYSKLELQQIRDSVGQAAPVLANLRNLSIAELRAATDSLTGLPNKRAVDDTLKRMFAQASRTLSPLTMLMLDLDHFKEINDRFGHPVGDEVLANVGEALRSSIRESDFAGRSGGEEFVVLLPTTEVAGALLTAEKIREAIGAIALAGLELTVTASVGVAAYPDHALSPERLTRLADAALYVAKQLGRDRIEVAAGESHGAVSPSSDRSA
jgi:diguanylate cyclase (GGDEF)-like protein